MSSKRGGSKQSSTKNHKKKNPAATNNGEVQIQKSPAEFFAEHQAIAGFDNAGKSLFTSLRELVENGLDAAESIAELPQIDIELREYTQAEFNRLRGDSPAKQVNPDLYVVKAKKTAATKKLKEGTTTTTDKEDPKKKKTAKQNKSTKPNGNESDNDDDDEEEYQDPASTTTKAVCTPGADEPNDTTTKNNNNNNTKDGKKAVRRKAPQEAYFSLSVQDNGCGMSHDAIPQLLGRVLSGSKYGVRQTRGKFGLGSKMALIWSKKSTGMPIHVTSSHRPNGGLPAATWSYCQLDMDIHHNEPRILEHTQHDNTCPETTPWVGTRVQLMIAGNWTTYKSRILHYLQQLAIITPYAQIRFCYSNASDPKRQDVTVRYERRSEQMPPPAQQVKHHPASVNNLIVQQLLQQTKTKTLHKFLSTELAAVSPAMAHKLVAEVNVSPDLKPLELVDKKITRLVQVLRSVQFKNPDGSCLSPLGEYNLNLGIRKVLEPDTVATARDRPSAYEGHPFVVEAAVSLGGPHVKEGITVIRFANRIPLLFEGGADVATRVAHTKLKWTQYKMDPKRDKIGVFVSIVSTKIPFKGTSKEYIGDDATEIQQSVKRALQACCQQLRVHLTKRNAMKDAKERKSKLAKYIPNISQSLMGILNGMKNGWTEPVDNDEQQEEASSSTGEPPCKRPRLDLVQTRAFLDQVDRKEITQKTIEQRLRKAIEGSGMDGTSDDPAQLLPAADRRKPLLSLVPLYNMEDPTHDIYHAHFRFRPIKPILDLTTASGSDPQEDSFHCTDPAILCRKTRIAERYGCSFEENSMCPMDRST